MSGGSGYLTDCKIDNSKDWEVTLDAKFSGNGCGLLFVKSGTTVRDKNQILFTNNQNTSNNRSILLMKEDNVSHANQTLNLRYPAYNTYASFVIRKQNDIYTVIIDDLYTLSIIAPTFETTCPELCIGVDTWGTTATVKNIKLKYL